MVINPLVMEYEWLVGGLEHEWIMTFHSVGNEKSSQLTNSIIFQKGWNHQPDNVGKFDHDRTATETWNHG